MQNICDFLEKKKYNNLRYKTIFTLSTCSPDSPDIVKLKEAIEELMEEERYPIPLVWFNLKQQIQEKGKKTFTLPEVKEMARMIETSAPLNINAALSFFHAVGDLVFFEELPKCIVTDPQWLIDQFKKIITIKPDNEPRCSALRAQLDDYGYLHGELLGEIWPNVKEREHMVELLKKFALLLPVEEYWSRNSDLIRPENEKEKEYLVPCLLRPVKVCSEKEDISQPLVSKPQPLVLKPPAEQSKQEEINMCQPLVLKPVCDFIPAGLTGRLMSSLCIEDGWEICGQAYANDVTFELEDDCKIRLCMKSSPKRIEIRCTRFGDKPLNESLQKIAKRIANLPGTVEFNVCIQCTHVEEMSRLGTLSRIHKIVKQNRPICDHDGTRLRDSEYSAWFFDSTSTGRNAFSDN